MECLQPSTDSARMAPRLRYRENAVFMVNKPLTLAFTGNFRLPETSVRDAEYRRVPRDIIPVSPPCPMPGVGTRQQKE